MRVFLLTLLIIGISQSAFGICYQIQESTLPTSPNSLQSVEAITTHYCQVEGQSSFIPYRLSNDVNLEDELIDPLFDAFSAAHGGKIALSSSAGVVLLDAGGNLTRIPLEGEFTREVLPLADSKWVAIRSLPTGKDKANVAPFILYLDQNGEKNEKKIKTYSYLSPEVKKSFTGKLDDVAGFFHAKLLGVTESGAWIESSSNAVARLVFFPHPTETNPNPEAEIVVPKPKTETGTVATDANVRPSFICKPHFFKNGNVLTYLRESTIDRMSEKALSEKISIALFDPTGQPIDLGSGTVGPDGKPEMREELIGSPSLIDCNDQKTTIPFVIEAMKEGANEYQRIEFDENGNKTADFKSLSTSEMYDKRAKPSVQPLSDHTSVEFHSKSQESYLVVGDKRILLPPCFKYNSQLSIVDEKEGIFAFVAETRIGGSWWLPKLKYELVILNSNGKILSKTEIPSSVDRKLFIFPNGTIATRGVGGHFYFFNQK